MAPVNAPLSWPNSSLSRSPSDGRTVSFDKRPLPPAAAIMKARAMSSFPVPVSPERVLWNPSARRPPPADTFSSVTLSPMISLEIVFRPDSSSKYSSLREPLLERRNSCRPVHSRWTMAIWCAPGTEVRFRPGVKSCFARTHHVQRAKTLSRTKERMRASGRLVQQASSDHRFDGQSLQSASIDQQASWS